MKKFNKNKKLTESKPAFLSESSQDFLFNHSIKSNPSSSKPLKKRKPSKQVFEDLEEDLPNKKRPHASDFSSSTFFDEETFFSSLQSDISSFFLNNKVSYHSLTRLSGIKYSIGSYVLGAINDKGPNGLYMIISLSRNKKAFISKEDSPINLDAFDIGDYVLAQIIPPRQGSLNDSKTTQLTIKPEVLNSDNKDYIENMVISAILTNVEDHGWTFALGNGFQAFVKKQKNEENPILIQKKPYLLKIVEKPKKSGLLICDFLGKSDPPMKKPKDFSSDLKPFLHPANLFNVKIVKILENGLLVKFFGGILGFIYDEHLLDSIKNYTVNTTILARILLFDPESKRIVLSCKSNLLEMTPLHIENLGKISKGCENVIKASGGNFWLKVDGNNIFVSKKQSGKLEEITDFSKIQVKIKEFNYLEGVCLGTVLEEFLNNSQLSWREMKAGDFISGKILSLKENKLLISFNNNKIKGMVDTLNFSDKPFKGFIKPKYKENKGVRARILSLDPVNKRLFLTLKPIFLQENLEILKDLDQVKPGDYYYGYISGENSFGFIISFFNEIKGILSFKHLEEVEKIERSSLTLGKTLKVYILFVNNEMRKLGLSLTKPSKIETAHNISKTVNYEKRFEEFIKKKSDFFDIYEDINIGDISEYTILKKPEDFPEGFLLLQNKTHEKPYKAIIYKDHLSDIPLQNSKIFEVYDKMIRKNEYLSGIVIGKINNILIVSAKKSLISQYKNYRTFPVSHLQLTMKTTYYCYVQRVTNKGIIVKLHENLTGFLPFTKIDGFFDKITHDLPEKSEEKHEIYDENMAIQCFPPCKTLKISIASIKTDPKPMVLCSMLEKETKHRDHPKEFSLIQGFLDEEALLAKILKKTAIFEKLSIGDYVRGEITHSKEYGVIVKLINYENYIGFIILENLIDEKNVYHKGYILQARVLDLDCEKEIVDLKEIRITEEKFEKLRNKTHFNVKKIIKKTALFKKNGQIFKEAKVLLVKENFLVIGLNEFKGKVIGLLEAKTVNNYKKTHEIYEINAILPEISLQNFTHISKLNKKFESIDFSNKFTYIPVFSVHNPPSSLESKRLPSSNSTIDQGQKLEGKIVKIQKNGVLVQLNHQEFRLGHIHLTQFDYDPITHRPPVHSIGEKLQCKVFHKPQTDVNSHKKPYKKHENLLELTCLSTHMDLPDSELNQMALFPIMSEIEALLKNDENTLKSQFFPALIRSLAPNSINPLYFELSNNVFGSVSAFFDLMSPASFEKLNNLQEYYHEGDVYPVRIKGFIKKVDDKARIFKSIQLTLIDEINSISETSLERGSMILIKIVKKLNNSLRVQISPTKFASIDLLEICDEFILNPLNRYPIGHYLQARVLHVSTDKLELSIRETLTNQRNWEILTTKSTLAYKKAFDDIENQGDLRSRIHKLGVTSLKPGMIFLGYVHQTNDKGCFIKIDRNTTARAKLTELTDENINDTTSYELKFYKNRLVLGRIINILPDQKIEVSIRESVVKYGFPLEIDKLTVGLIVDGWVIGYAKDKALIRMKGCKYMGSLNIYDSDRVGEDEESLNVNKVFPMGMKVRAKILNVQKEPKLRIKLGNKKEHLEQQMEAEGEGVMMDEKYAQLYDSIEIMMKEEKGVTQNMDIEEVKEDMKEEVEGKEDIEELKEDVSKEEDVEEAMMDIEEENNDDDDDDSGDNIDSEEDGENEEAVEEVDEEKEDIKEKEENMDNDDEEVKKPKKKTKKQKQKDFLEKEIEIRKEERNLLENQENPPTSIDDYEKLLLKTPNSSFVWINYIAFLMEQKGVEEARSLAERALKALNFKSETEKFNIWVTYLNLENSFGSEKALIKVFERALAANDPKKVYFKLLEIYRRNEQYELVVELSKKMIKKHKNSCKAWIEFIKNLMLSKTSEKNEDLDLKEYVKRALQSLQKKKHLKFLSHYGRLEFLHGDAEKGRTTFEAIVTNYPKRYKFYK